MFAFLQFPRGAGEKKSQKLNLLLAKLLYQMRSINGKKQLCYVFTVMSGLLAKLLYQCAVN